MSNYKNKGVGQHLIFEIFTNNFFFLIVQLIVFHLFKMKILFAVDSLFSELPKKIITKGLNARILKLSIPGAGVQELGLAIVNRVMAMNPTTRMLLLSAGTNNARQPT